MMNSNAALPLHYDSLHMILLYTFGKPDTQEKYLYYCNMNLMS